MVRNRLRNIAKGDVLVRKEILSKAIDEYCKQQGSPKNFCFEHKGKIYFLEVYPSYSYNNKKGK